MPSIVVPVLVKIIFEPRVHVSDMVDAAKQVFGSIDISLDISLLTVNRLRAGFQTVDVGDRCAAPREGEEDLVAQHVRLMLDSANDPELVVYTTKRLSPDADGCAKSISDRPMALLAETASRWSLAHEVAHLLGVPGHVADRSNLMCRSTHRIEGVPTISDQQARTIRDAATRRDP